MFAISGSGSGRGERRCRTPAPVAVLCCAVRTAARSISKARPFHELRLPVVSFGPGCWQRTLTAPPTPATASISPSLSFFADLIPFSSHSAPRSDFLLRRDIPLIFSDVKSNDFAISVSSYFRFIRF